LNYNEKHPTISFRVDKKYKIFLDNDAEKQSTAPTQIANDIIKKYYDGDLVDKKSDIVLEMQKLRIEKLKQEIKYMEIKNNFATNFNRPISRSATVHIKPEIVVESATKEIIHSPYDAQNKRLQCVECMCLFTWTGKNDFIDQLGEFHRHLLSKHNRELNPIEKDVVLKLEYEGDST
jgi:hypothetical protein